MSAPSEATSLDEWRAIYTAVTGANDGTLNAAGQLSDAVTMYHVAAEDLFTDLRPSEEQELQNAVHDALDPVRARFTAELIEAGAAAALTFAAEHPDAPRAAREAADLAGAAS
jgi:hypothetical protein